jgi:hypothetical protein
MIEFFSIFIQLVLITIICYVPTNICLFLKSNNNLDILNRLEIGIILNLFVLLILSFVLRSGSNVVYYILIIRIFKTKHITIKVFSVCLIKVPFLLLKFFSHQHQFAALSILNKIHNEIKYKFIIFHL